MKHIILLVLASLLSGCGGGGGGYGSSSPAPNPPTVMAVAPANDGTGVAANVVIKTTFSEAVSSETLGGPWGRLPSTAGNVAVVTLDGRVLLNVPQ
jgi:hypothetical protein